MKIEDPEFYDPQNLLLYDINFPMMTQKQLDLLVDKSEYTIELEEAKQEMSVKGANASYQEKIQKLEEKLKENKITLANSFKEDMEDIDDVFITFASKRQKKLFLDKNNLNCCQRKCMSKYDHLRFRDKFLDINHEIDEPSNVQWANIQFSHGQRCFRVFFSIIVCIIIIIISKKANS
jgi:hypothetical protein